MGHVDYTKGTGDGGTMLIRVADSSGTSGVISANDVQFHIRSGQDGTYVGSPGFVWTGYYNGSWRLSGRIANISGREWRHVATFDVSTNQSVAFHIDNSGTQGFGGPTDFWVSVTRATVPPAPTALGLDLITHTTMRYKFSSNGTGGSAIIEWQIGYGTSPTSVQFTLKSPGTSTVTGLSMGTTWYFWSRGRNAVGWGGWSSRSFARTIAGSRLKVAGVWKEAIPMVKVAGVWRQAIPYIRSAGVWKDGQ